MNDCFRKTPMPGAKVKSILDLPLDPEAEAAADAAADAEIKAGKGVPHERVREWLRRLVNGERVPPPDWLKNAWAGAKRRDLETVTLDDINAEIDAYRREKEPAASGQGT
jgi:hypothetical protein